MKLTSKIKIIAVAAIFGIVSLSAFITETNAQTKRKIRTKTGSVRPQTTPTPVQTEPEIISQASDYNSEPQIVQPQQTEIQPNDTNDDRIDKTNSRVKELSTRVKNLEATKKDPYEEKQKRLLLNLDILTRAEQRAETLRKQLFEMVEKESTIKTRLDNIESDIRPEMIERQVAFAGTLKPEELRDMKRKSLENEKRNLQNLLTDIQNTRSNLELNVQKADQLVEKLRFKLEKDIDDALADEPQQ
ncbi:MAG TPA: hypothetical protein PKY59_20780 [Pyrinomonadaceae bacterium]|nr:hypothetical protein [Pyrinomonadaceae bacterium]